MKSSEIRQAFLEFFASKAHKIVPSAPIVNKDDPTLMFINAGMNPFKDYFLGNLEIVNPRISDTQKCLRVSGKHNDLDEVGRDGYHHTMFEMLGNWSFGDYFKEEAIAWAWEYLTDVLKIDKDRLYISVFGGDKKDSLEEDTEAVNYWENWLAEDRILRFDKKDNFWEMGETGPCGPCSEIHVDMRSEADRQKTDGKVLVNADHPEVIEIWNLVFIQFNRLADGSLGELPAKHIDTGMGFERLAMVMQNKLSSYDTDVFAPYILKLEELSGHKYTASYEPDAEKDLAMRVVADHVRAVSFAISDGQMPSNTGAGYVIRRILRRAVRYSYSFLDIDEPSMYKLVAVMVEYYGNVFPGLVAQKSFIENVIKEEEKSFLQTLSSGIKRLNQLMTGAKTISGQEAFELYDTFGFPIDLTKLIAQEKGISLDEEAFEKALEEQKARSRKDSIRSVGDWTEIRDVKKTDFVGYDQVEATGLEITKHRVVDRKGKSAFQLVLNKSPFYPEGGGQVGDRGILKSAGESIKVLNTIKENDLILHIVDKLPSDPEAQFEASVDSVRRSSITKNHSATHLLHAALRSVLGNHVQQKGSLVNESYLRFDFSHHQKMSLDEIKQVEQIVNDKIRANITMIEMRDLPIKEAKDKGAMMLFGEKYGESVRMITFDSEYSVELCGGCHVAATGEIGWFKITSESAIAAGVRRIEASTSIEAQKYIQSKLDELISLQERLNNPQDSLTSLDQLLTDHKSLQKKMDSLAISQVADVKSRLSSATRTIGNHKVIAEKIKLIDPKSAKTLLFQLIKEQKDALVVLGIDADDKAQLMIGMDKEFAESSGLNAGNLIKELSKDIRGGGGGQAFFATAGGSYPEGIDTALARLKDLLE